MDLEVSESAQDNFGKFIYQFQPETKKLIRKLEKILNKLYWQNLSLLFNETCLNEWLLPNHTHTHTHTYIYIYVLCTQLFRYISISNQDPVLKYCGSPPTANKKPNFGKVFFYLSGKVYFGYHTDLPDRVTVDKNKLRVFIIFLLSWIFTFLSTSRLSKLDLIIRIHFWISGESGITTSLLLLPGSISGGICRTY